ncbi:MAG: hypothetical protein VKK62_11205 [Synechococcaceae cyanobacterium]|nr:hypothetical protein [Synechococcaceae cyanobacterium]
METGEGEVITRRGKRIAELVPRGSLPDQPIDGVETFRALRDEANA